MVRHSQLRQEYEKWCCYEGVRSAFRPGPLPTYRDIFSTAESKRMSNAGVPYLIMRNFVNKREQRLHSDLAGLGLVDLRLHLNMLLTITADLYSTRKLLTNELNNVVASCIASLPWQENKIEQRQSELDFVRTAHLDRKHIWHLDTPIEWMEKYTGFRYPREINAARLDLLEVKRYLVMCAEDREFLVWHVAELRKVLKILTADLSQAPRLPSLVDAKAGFG